MTQYHSTRPVHGLDIAYSRVCSADLIANRFQAVNGSTGANTTPTADRSTWVHRSFRFSDAVSQLCFSNVRVSLCAYLNAYDPMHPDYGPYDL